MIGLRVIGVFELALTTTYRRRHTGVSKLSAVLWDGWMLDKHGMGSYKIPGFGLWKG